MVLALRRLLQEDFFIGTGFPGQMFGNLHRPVVHFAMQRGQIGVGRGHDVAIDVATGTAGIHAYLVGALEQRPQVLLEHAVVLKRLTGGQAQRAIGVAMGQFVNLEPLLTRDHACR